MRATIICTNNNGLSLSLQRTAISNDEIFAIESITVLFTFTVLVFVFQSITFTVNNKDSLHKVWLKFTFGLLMKARTHIHSYRFSVKLCHFNKSISLVKTNKFYSTNNNNNNKELFKIK